MSALSLAAAPAWGAEPARLNDGPLALASAVALALARNPSVAEAEARVEAARALGRQARSGFWPRADLEASYTVTDNSALAFSYILNQRAFAPSLDFNDVDTVDDLNLAATVELPLFTGFARSSAVDAAERGLEAARAGRSVVLHRLSAETARAWLGAFAARRFVEASRAGVEGLEAAVEVARRRFEAGTLLRQAVLEIEVRLAAAREQLGRAENGEALAKEALRALLHVDEGTPLELAELPDPAPPPPPGERAEAPPALQAAKSAVEAADAAVGRAESGWWPQVGLRGSVIYDRGFIEDGDKLSYVAGLGVTWSVWDGFETSGRVDEARAEAAERRAALDRLDRRLRLAVAEARIRVRDARARVEQSTRAIELAEESVDLVRTRFEEGVALPTQLIDAETELTRARVRRARAEADLGVAAVELRRALGLTPVPLPGE